MLTRRIIPCLDTDGGRVVKGIRFEELRDRGDPAELAGRYQQQGADEIVVLDVSATVQARGHRLETVRTIRAALGIPLCVGGGVRTVDDAAALLAAGADKVAVNSAAVADPALLSTLAAHFGSQAVVLAIDARLEHARYVVRTHAGRTGTPRDAIAWAEEGAERGAGEILLTSMDRDGTGEGYDLELLAAVRAVTSIPLIASGGARTPDHLTAALAAGADAVLVASMLHDGLTTVGDLKHRLRALDLPLRP